MNDRSFMVMIDIGRDLPICPSITRVSRGTRDSALETFKGLIVPS